MKIKAAVVPGKEEKYQIQEVELKNELKAHDVLVKIVATGMCKSDYTIRTNDVIGFSNILGHEGSGIVEEVGEAVTTVEQGDHVVLAYSYCGECKQCLNGHPSSCENWRENNNNGKNLENDYVFQSKDGENIKNFYNQSSFATYSLTDQSNVIKVDKDIDLRLLGPLSCGFTTGSGAIFSSVNPNPGEGIAVFGTGAVGFSAIMAAKIAGCHPIVAIDINDQRLEQAKELGATHTFNNSEKDPVEFLTELTNSKGIEYTLDTTGVPEVLKAAVNSLSSSGAFIPVSMEGELSLDVFNELSVYNRRIIGSLMGDVVPQLHVSQLIQFYKNGEFPFDKLTKFYDFEDINEAEDASLSGEVIKPILVIDEDYEPEK